MKRLCTLFFIGLLFLTGCGASASPGQERPDSANNVKQISVTDDLGREVSLSAPKRVAALIGSFADVWCLAGGRETLVATAHDAWTSFDLGLDDSTADLGAIKAPNLEVLLAAEPDLILASCNTAANLELQSTFERLEIPVLYFDIQTFEDYLRMLKVCTTLTGQPEFYQIYGADVQTKIDAAIEQADGSQPTILCLRATGSGCKVKGSQDNVLGEMLADLGCVNLADNQTGLLENLSIEAILAADPDYIFAVLQGADAADAQKTLEQTLLSNPAWGSLTAVENGRFHTLDHRLYNLKPNARWGEAYEALAELLYK